MFFSLPRHSNNCFSPESARVYLESHLIFSYCIIILVCVKLNFPLCNLHCSCYLDLQENQRISRMKLSQQKHWWNWHLLNSREYLWAIFKSSIMLSSEGYLWIQLKGEQVWNSYIPQIRKLCTKYWNLDLKSRSTTCAPQSFCWLVYGLEKTGKLISEFNLLKSL